MVEYEPPWPEGVHFVLDVKDAEDGSDALVFSFICSAIQLAVLKEEEREQLRGTKGHWVEVSRGPTKNLRIRIITQSDLDADST